MNNIRWYDKNPDLKEVFEFIQKLDKTRQDSIAQEIIQILMNDFNLNLDKEINTIAKNYTYNCKRWYDNNIDLFTSFDIIRAFPKDLQQQVANKIVATVLFMYFDEEGTKK